MLSERFRQKKFSEEDEKDKEETSCEEEPLPGTYRSTNHSSNGARDQTRPPETNPAHDRGVQDAGGTQQPRCWNSVSERQRHVWIGGGGERRSKDPVGPSEHKQAAQTRLRWQQWREATGGESRQVGESRKQQNPEQKLSKATKKLIQKIEEQNPLIMTGTCPGCTLPFAP